MAAVSEPAVEAAGGVVWRRAPSGATEVLLVHRPKYDDWSLPKGKLAPGEAYEQAALREVAEETGLRCSLGPELETTTYRDAADRPKVVRYWAMTPVDGRFSPSHEVDQVRWVPVAEVGGVLTYDRDSAVVQALSTVL